MALKEILESGIFVKKHGAGSRGPSGSGTTYEPSNTVVDRQILLVLGTTNFYVRELYVPHDKQIYSFHCVGTELGGSTHLADRPRMITVDASYDNSAQPTLIYKMEMSRRVNEIRKREQAARGEIELPVDRECWKKHELPEVVDEELPGAGDTVHPFTCGPTDSREFHVEPARNVVEPDDQFQTGRVGPPNPEGPMEEFRKNDPSMFVQVKVHNGGEPDTPLRDLPAPNKLRDVPSGESNE